MCLGKDMFFSVLWQMPAFLSVLELILPSVFHRAAREAGDDASVSFIDLHD